LNKSSPQRLKEHREEQKAFSFGLSAHMAGEGKEPAAAPAGKFDEVQRIHLPSMAPFAGATSYYGSRQSMATAA